MKSLLTENLVWIIIVTLTILLNAIFNKGDNEND